MILFPKRYSAEYSFLFFFIQHQWIERKMLWLRYHKSSHMKPLDYFVCVWWREIISVNNVLNFGHKTIKRLEIKHACCMDWFCVVSFLEYFSYFLLEQQVNKTEQSVSCVWVCFTFPLFLWQWRWGRCHDGLQFKRLPLQRLSGGNAHLLHGWGRWRRWWIWWWRGLSPALVQPVHHAQVLPAAMSEDWSTTSFCFLFCNSTFLSLSVWEGHWRTRL